MRHVYLKHNTQYFKTTTSLIANAKSKSSEFLNTSTNESLERTVITCPNT
jgi:hypothetical protein